MADTTETPAEPTSSAASSKSFNRLSEGPAVPDDRPNLDDLLTDEERRDLSMSEGEIEDDPDDEPDEGATDAAPEDDADDDPAPEPEDDAEDKPDAAAADDDPDAEDDPDPEPEQQPDPYIPVDDSPIRAMDEERAEAISALKDGEITEDELAEKLTDIQSRRDEALSKVAVAKDRAEGWMQRWGKEVRRYESEVGELFTAPHSDDFDKVVRSINANPKYENLSLRGRLEKAHKVYKAMAEDEDFKVPDLPGRKKAARADPKPEPDPKPEAKDQPRQPDAPRTLRDVPAAAINDPQESVFANLDQMLDGNDPERYETALGKLSPAQRDAYLRR